MTLNNAAWAINGSTMSADLARVAEYVATGGEGVVSKGDLKVTPLSTPGNGVRIAGGAGLVLNRYLTTPDESYVVRNNGIHTHNPAISANASEQTYIVGIAVGDPDFSQTGHPFMLSSDPPDGEEDTFNYVRPVVVLETAFNARAYPAIPLARIVVPASTTTITSGMITDLRKLARPRTELKVAAVAGPGSTNALNGGGGTPGTYERWPNVGVLQVAIPSWAVKAKIIGFIEGLKLTKAGHGKIRAYVEGESLPGFVTNWNENAPGATNDRRAYNFAGEIDVTSIAGTTKTFSVQATPDDTPSKGALVADGSSSVAMQVYFEEQPT